MPCGKDHAGLQAAHFQDRLQGEEMVLQLAVRMPVEALFRDKDAAGFILKHRASLDPINWRMLCHQPADEVVTAMS